MILPTKYARIRWDEEHAQAWISETFTWTDRTNYLVWVAAWKAELKAKIADIKDQKAIRRDPAKTQDDRSAAQSKRHYLRIECANLMLLRMMAKKLAASQRQQRLTELTPTA